MEKDFVLEKVGWYTKIIRNYQFDNLAMYKLFARFLVFLQENNLSTKTLISSGEIANDETSIRFGDLTEEGYLFFKAAYGRWADNIIDKGKSPEDVKYLEKKLKEI